MPTRRKRKGLDSWTCISASVVVADNVLFAQIDDYREYTRSLATKDLVTTKLVLTQIEYAGEEIPGDDGSDNNDASGGDGDAGGTEDADLFRDGIEITHYKRNPLADR